MADQSSGPLAGLLVADFSRILSGPFCTMMLADLGADVIKVEAPSRRRHAFPWGPPLREDVAAYFHSVNRNKRRLAVDLKDPGGLAIAQELADSAD